MTKLDAAPPERLENVNLNQVTQSVLHMLEPLAQDGTITLKFQAAAPCIVEATADDFYQIAFNLIENAIKYSFPKGIVTVSLEKTPAAVIFRVEDNGVGIPEEDLTKVFDRFYRVDKARSREAGGTGLGLSIVQESVLRYGGTVQAARRPEGGTCFTVVFPTKPQLKENQNEAKTE